MPRRLPILRVSPPWGRLTLPLRLVNRHREDACTAHPPRGTGFEIHNQIITPTGAPQDKASRFLGRSPRPIAAVNQGFALLVPRTMTPRPTDAASKRHRTFRACDGNQS